MPTVTRAEFEARRTRARRVVQRENWVLTLTSVGGGVAQLIFLFWADRHLERQPKLAIAGPIFLVYAALVVWLLWRMTRRIRAARPVCPSCGSVMSELTERVASATGRCDQCGGQVIA